MTIPLPSFNQELAQQFSELHPDGFVSVDGDGRILHMNGVAERVTGIRRADVVGREVREALPLRDLDGTLWWDCVDPWHGLNTRSGTRERLLMLPGNHEVLVTSRYIRPGRGQPVVRVLLALRDAEARRRVEKENSNLISTVAHELRSPLTSVKGFSATLLKKWDRFADEQKLFMLQAIETEADRVTRLISELLDVSRIDVGRLRVHPQPVQVRAVFERHIERAAAVGYDESRFVLDVPDDLPETWADPDRLEQILANLIENALRHGKHQVTLSAKAINGAEVDLIVSDDGEGIPEEHRSMVFSRFWQGRSRGSSGLGLYIVKGLAEAHGGTVTAEASPEGGALIRVRLPNVPPDHLA